MRIHRKETKFRSLIMKHRGKTIRSVQVYPSHIEDSGEDNLVYMFSFRPNGQVVGATHQYQVGKVPSSCA